MTLFQKIVTGHEVKAATAVVPLLERTATVVNNLQEVSISTLKDGRWLYCQNHGNAIPCVTASPDYRDIYAYTLDGAAEEMAV